MRSIPEGMSSASPGQVVDGCLPRCPDRGALPRGVRSSRSSTHDRVDGAVARGRRRSSRLLASFTLLAKVLVSAQAHGASPTTDWSADAHRDLAAMHDLIRDNHPGPVDDQDQAFRAWMEAGPGTLRAQADAARTEHDYRLVLLDYANGFADVHLRVRFDQPERELWPGFLTRTDHVGGPSRVVLVEDAPGIAVGDGLVGCGTASASDLLAARVLRPLTNPKQPQGLILTSPWLTVVSADDRDGQTPDCRIRTAAGLRTVPVRWRSIDQAALSTRIAQASGIAIPALGLRRVGDVWLVSLPSFTWSGPDAARMQALVATLRDHASELHAARHVVLDLRGNGGGNSQWGIDVASALWGGKMVEAIEASEDGTVDWRVSTRNRDTIRADAADMMTGGHPEEAAEWIGLARRMDQALKAGQPLMREAGTPGPAMPAGPSPFSHRVLVLTDPHCASACLDFVDLLNRLPGTERIGLPTGADTNYLDLATAPLPSGRASLAYAMKVYRHRARAANAAYQPVLAWPGGVMTDTSVSRWVGRLPAG